MQPVRDSLRKLASAPRRALRGFDADRILLRAAALTYLTIVSLVPLLAVALQLMEALGLLDLRSEVREFILSNLAVGARTTVAGHLDQLLTTAGESTAGVVGFLVLLVSAILLLRNIEEAFADLWGLHNTRPLWVQIPVSFGVLLAGPVALGISLAMTAALRGWAALGGLPVEAIYYGAAPLGIAVFGFTALYLIAPTAKVRFRAALAGGVLAGAVWEIAKYVYAAYAARALRTDLLYGSLGALPLFLLWMYVSWLITLFGARLAYAIQHPDGILVAADDPEAARALELCALRLCVSCAIAKKDGQTVTVHGLAREQAVPEALVRKALALLEDQEIVEVHRRRVELKAPPEKTSLGDVLQAVRRHARRPEVADPVGEHLSRLLCEADERAAELLAGESLLEAGAVGHPLA